MSYKTPALHTFTWQQPVKDKDLTAPPGGEVKGDRYIVKATGSGLWSAKDNQIATYNGAGWDFTVPTEGMITWVNDEDVYYIYNGTLWFSENIDITEPTGFIDRVATLSFVPGASGVTREFTITGNHDIYIKGVRISKTTATIAIADTTGLHWIYYSASGVLSTSLTHPGFHVPLIATLYWNTATDTYLLGEERHGIIMDGTTHGFLHDTVGIRFHSGLAGTFANTTFSIALGIIDDEDLEISITPAKTTCNVLYHSGSGEFAWDAGATLYYKLNSTTLRYNNVNALADVTNNYHVAYWIFATNDPTTPIVSLMGQREDLKLIDAEANNKYESLTLGTLPYQEMKLLYRVILKNASGTATFIEAQDLRNVSNLPAGTYLASLHSALTGLTNLDHPASAIKADTTNFAGLLSSADDTVQKALDTLDDNAGTGQSSCLVYQNASVQAIPTGTPTKVTLDAELWDNQNEFTGSTFTAKVAGKYSVGFCVGISSLGDGDIIYSYIYKNGVWTHTNMFRLGGAGSNTNQVSTIMTLAINDYVDFYAEHDYGSNRNTINQIQYTWAFIHKL